MSMWQTQRCSKQGARLSKRRVIGRPFIAPPSSRGNLWSFEPYSFQNKQVERGESGWQTPFAPPVDPPLVGDVSNVRPSSEQIKLKLQTPII